MLIRPIQAMDEGIMAGDTATKGMCLKQMGKLRDSYMAIPNKLAGRMPLGESFWIPSYIFQCFPILTSLDYTYTKRTPISYKYWSILLYCWHRLLYMQNWAHIVSLPLDSLPSFTPDYWTLLKFSLIRSTMIISVRKMLTLWTLESLFENPMGHQLGGHELECDCHLIKDEFREC